MKLSTNILPIIARLNTPVKGYFGPHRGLASLNPQPLPPMEIGAMLAETYTKFVVERKVNGFDIDEPGLGNDTDMIWINIVLGPPKDPGVHPNWWRRFGQEPIEREVALAIRLAFAARLFEIAALSNDEALNKRLNIVVEAVLADVEESLG